ncbi:MAG: hypothetical protein KME26_12610 [Oscillatoria princeps RMCB-10]|nr:hypothetical protein [Oscillatoria princeps RMCB-10]
MRSGANFGIHKEKAGNTSPVRGKASGSGMPVRGDGSMVRIWDIKSPAQSGHVNSVQRSPPPITDSQTPPGDKFDTNQPEFVLG